MNNPDLDSLLKSARVPDRDAAYWAAFPKAVIRLLGGARNPGFSRPVRRSFSIVAWGFGLAAACLLAGFFGWFWNGRHTSTEASQTAAMRIYFREIEGLFPNQVRAIVLDESGPHLVLSEMADVPKSSPLYLKICGPSGCRRFITFSGQQIRVNGELLEVLADAGGRVIVAGGNMVWSSALPRPARLPYRIEAQTLEAAL